MKAHIGDVVVHRGEPKNGNPYSPGGLLGSVRRLALLVFRTGAPIAEFTFWYAPASGGARRIQASEVDWETSGVGSISAGSPTETLIFAWHVLPRVRIDSLHRGDIFASSEGEVWRYVRRDGALSGVHHVESLGGEQHTSFAGSAEVIAL